MLIILESGPADRKVARALARMASDDQITYTPTGYAARGHAVVWHQMRAECPSRNETWTYYLRRDYGSYAGAFEV